MEPETRIRIVVGTGVAVIFALAMVVGDSFSGLLGMFACALVAGIACGALVANDERKSFRPRGRKLPEKRQR